jgi:ketosteroid isomerase-like protein
MDLAQPQSNVDLLNRFYRAFTALDADTMAACYAAEATFQDEVFKLDGRDQIGSMWRMLANATRTKGLDAWSLEFSDLQADADQGRAHWEAHYRFSATGRLVHNIIEARFEFRDGLIVSHRDRFDFWSWSRQALGTPGWLLGWSPLLRKKVQVQAAANLKAFGQSAA